jgi:hypothetical protein
MKDVVLMCDKDTCSGRKYPCTVTMHRVTQLVTGNTTTMYCTVTGNQVRAKILWASDKEEDLDNG